MREDNRTINCNGKLLDLSEPKVMGILNITPDSFYDGGNFVNEEKIIVQVQKMIHEGLDILDIGGQSTRPKADFLSPEEEWSRIHGHLEKIKKHFPNLIISVDTFHSQVAEKAVKVGASIINDISAGSIDPKMFETIRELQVPYVLMHMRGTPETMQKNATYDDVFSTVFYFFTEKLNELSQLGVNDIILDPGFGFGKNEQANYQLLNRMDEFGELGCPILSGTSRKSMLYKLLNSSAAQALNATTVSNTIALMKGAHILRVHDVKEAKEAIKIVAKLKEHAE